MKELLIGKNIEAHFIDFVNLEKKESTPPAKNHLEIDTTKNIEDNHKQISEFLIHLPLSSPTSTDSFVIVPNGLGGVGKTTVLTKVAEETHAVVVDTDNPTLNYLMGKFPVASDYYGKYIKANRYQCSFDILQENLELGKSGIIDGFLGDRLNTPPVEKLKGIPNIKFLITQFHCSLEVQEENLRERGAARDEEKLKGNNLSRDRQSTVTRLIPNLVDSRNTLQISTENHDDLKKNVEIIKSHLSSPNFKSSTLAPRSIPLDPKLLNISTEQVKGDLDSLNLLVNEIRFEDNINKIAAESKAAPIPNLTGLKHHGLFKRSESAHNLPALKPKKSFLKY
jgi:predicted kinase